MPRRLRFLLRINRWLRSVGFPSDWHLIPLAAGIGALAGLAAVGFNRLVEEIGALLYTQWTVSHQSAWEYLAIVLLPAGGGLLVGFIQERLSKRGPGHGVPEVIESLARHDGRIQARTGIYKTVNSSLTIGTGGSAGVEGPIIQIGAVIGSLIAQVLRVGREHMQTLVGCGAAAGLAAIFNAPIAGVLLVLEVMLRDFSFKTFIPIVVASVIGTAVEQAVLGQNAALFAVPEAMFSYQISLGELWAYAALGILAGLIGAGFTLSMHHSEHFFSTLKLPRLCRPALGGLLLGGMGLVFLSVFGRPGVSYDRPAFYANGYPVVEALLNPASYRTINHGGESIIDPDRKADSPALNARENERRSSAPDQSAPSHGSAEKEAAGKKPDPRDAPPPDDRAEAPSNPPPSGPGSEPSEHRVLSPQGMNAYTHSAIFVLLVMLIAKFAGTCLTLGSGGSGGVFAPSLFLGATLGGVFGVGLHQVGLFAGSTPATYALAGMAGVLAASVHCPLTAFILVFEITQDYKVILPVMLVSILATMMAQILHRDSVYTSWLRRRGIHMGSHSDMTLLRRLRARDVPLAPACVVHPEEPAQRLIDLAEEQVVNDYVVCDGGGRYLGMVVGEDVRTTLMQREAIPLMIVEELMRPEPPTVDQDETLDLVLDKFSRHDLSSLAVVDEQAHLRGIITRARLMRVYQRTLEKR